MTKTCLLDVNVLLALTWPHHVHHGIVHEWWRTAGLTRWASCTQTQLGFIRISCNPKLVPNPATPSHALTHLHRMTARKDHEFWPEAPSGTRDAEVARRLSASLTHQHVTDAYLAALANHHQGQVVTLDRSLVNGHPDVGILVT